MKVVVLTGNQANQKALCNKITKVCDVAAIVLSDNIPRKKPSLIKRMRTLMNRVFGRVFGRVFVDAWRELLLKYENDFPDFPNVPIVKVTNINARETIRILKKYEPDLIVVSGTNLVGSKIINFSKRGKGIVNLHTGISPYVKGGPNCTNWCLAKNWFGLIGNTIMWLDRGIDTGKIIATERTILRGDEDLMELHCKVMEHAHDLYLRAIARIVSGEEVPAVPQNALGHGRLFYTIDWNLFEMCKAKRNFSQKYKAFFRDEKENKVDGNVHLVSFD